MKSSLNLDRDAGASFGDASGVNDRCDPAQDARTISRPMEGRRFVGCSPGLLGIPGGWAWVKVASSGPRGIRRGRTGTSARQATYEPEQFLDARLEVLLRRAARASARCQGVVTILEPHDADRARQAVALD